MLKNYGKINLEKIRENAINDEKLCGYFAANLSITRRHILKCVNLLWVDNSTTIHQRHQIKLDNSNNFYATFHTHTKIFSKICRAVEVISKIIKFLLEILIDCEWHKVVESAQFHERYKYGARYTTTLAHIHTQNYKHTHNLNWPWFI